jgi:DNA (cytosine-5)-methyltransferase 1
MSGRPKLLDLCCCQGGAATGYHRAGFDILGVDIEPQPRYPFPMVRGDVLDVLDHWDLSPFAAIHVSPPCQFATTMSSRWRVRGGTAADHHINLLTPVLARVRRLGIPYVVENVVGAKRFMNPTLALHGGMFGLGVHRPRLFQCSMLILAPRAPMTKRPVGVYGDHPQNHYSTRQNGDMKGRRSEFRRARTLAEAQELMDMPWADWHGCKEAIPPAYTEYIGAQLLDALQEAA